MKQSPREKRLNRALVIAIEALSFYADPEEYTAITFRADRPSGGFADDFSKTDHPRFERKMPGKKARKAMAKMSKILKADRFSAEQAETRA